MLKQFYKRIYNKIHFPGLSLHSSVLLINKGKFIFGSKCSFDNDSVVIICDRLSMGNNVTVLKDTEIAAEDIEIGSYVSIQKHSCLFGKISIGSFCIFGPNLYISSGVHTFKKIPYLNIRDQEQLEKDMTDSKAVSIAEDCWLGINVVISPGVSIGKGCVIGANSVVTKDIPPYSIAVGAPAKVISKRLDFVPPAKIFPSVEFIPYLYSGFDTRPEFISLEGINLLSNIVEIFINTDKAKIMNIKFSGGSHVIVKSERFDKKNGIIKIPVNTNPQKIEFDLLEFKNIKVEEVWTE